MTEEVATPSRRAGWRRLALVAALLLGVAFSYRQILPLELLGWDTYPLIETCRLQSADDVEGVLTEELMDGAYPHGHFYRPVTSLSLGLDHARAGLEPFGYHLTDLLILLGGTVAILVLSYQLLGSFHAAWFTALFFGLHPIWFEVVPVTARRADSLCVMFLPPFDRRPGFRIGIGLPLALLALGAKETGAIIVPLVFALQLVTARHRGLGERVRWAFWRAASVVIALLIFLAVRTSVLGGMGGYERASLVASLPAAFSMTAYFGEKLLLPQPFSEGTAWLGPWVALVGVAGFLILWLGTQRTCAARGTAAATLGGLWLLCVLLITGVAGKPQVWYTAAFLPGACLLLGALALRTGQLWGQGNVRWAASGALFLALLGANQLRLSGLFRTYPELQQLSDDGALFLSRFEETVRTRSVGESVVLRGMPRGTFARRRVTGIRSVTGMTQYSVQSYARLRWPEVPVRIQKSDGTQVPKARPDVLTVGVVHRLPPDVEDFLERRANAKARPSARPTQDGPDD